jgi:hypothetical protein
MLRLLVGALHLALTVFVSLFDSQFSTHPTYSMKAAASDSRGGSIQQSHLV